MNKSDYNTIENFSKECNMISSTVIDDFLIYYAAGKEDLESKMAILFDKYKHIVKKIGKEYHSRLQAEYICHKIFKKNGYIIPYLQRPIVKELPGYQYQYLVDQAKTSWRYSFSYIVGKPSKYFFQIQDVFSGEEYLLYSPGMQTTLDDGNDGLWFLLLSFNGMCWQSFGLIIALRSFTPDDIFFYATEINPNIENNEDLINEIESNPIPFFMLISNAQLPITTMRGHLCQICHSEDDVPEFNIESLPADFKINSRNNVYAIYFQDLELPPHFATAYFDTNNNTLIRSSMTQKGFEELTKALCQVGYLLDHEPDVKVSMSMFVSAKEILNKKLIINPYESLFQPEEPKSKDDSLDKINVFIQLAIPFYNNKQEINIPALAKEAGLDEENAISVWNQVKKSLANMDKNISNNYK